jgi:glutamate racemase
MKLGIFDSGLGGLMITKSIRAAIPDIDMVYLGDTLHVPYGNRSESTIFEYTRNCMEALFAQDCNLIVIACNTASASALRQLQQQWLPGRYPGRNIIGVVVPTLETALERGYKNLGLIGTNYTVGSGVYEFELRKLQPDIQMTSKATPLLVPLIENDGAQWIPEILDHYVQPLLAQDIECLILGCTHYAFLKDHLRVILQDRVDIISQDDIIPAKLISYLSRHPEYADKLSRSGSTEFLVTDLTENYLKTAHVIYQSPVNVQKIAV